MRRSFILPEEDIEYLDASYSNWETITEGSHKWLIIHDFSISEGYNTDKVKVALRIDPGYPVSQIDMVYFSPHLYRKDGKAVGALAMQMIEGDQWQRWSRHRTPANPWRAGVDNVSTHLCQVSHWLEREFNLR